MPTQTVPEISEEMKQQLKNDRLMQYKARIFNVQMDIVAYQSVGDTSRLAVANSNLEELVTSYYAVEAMV